ncbi:plasmid mobilization relaxosome protein MobC [bacterium 1xD42-67]|nr:plasmid mobilization relaxosome protein MobC [bacterium 1xD42-67]
MSRADKRGRHHLHIELTLAQYQRLVAQAKQCGLSRRAYLVRLIEGTPIRARPSQEIKDLRTEIHHIGNNINRALVRAIANPTWQSGSKTLILRVIH